MSNDPRKRVFWLGMHVVLTKTELPRLRSLGYEVFNPPYLADVYDQSAVMDWDRSQRSTLPPEVFDELSKYNFFYNRISPRVAQLLNEYFGTVIVTISPTWLETMLEAYRGRIIYRVYGQPGSLSDVLWSMRLFRSIQEREDFHFVPHAEEAVSDEHAWLRQRMTVVPYTLPLDVFQHEGTWSECESHVPEIMACCPNIDNAHYANQYHYLNAHFPEPYIKLYGVQPRKSSDPRVVGTLPRDEQLSRYRRASGYWYHYDIRNCCYLPPVEMMAVGGPVVYMRGSLLARSFDSPGPGEATDIGDAKRKIRLMLAGDRGFLRELGAAQRQIVRRYHPDHVHPIFDRELRRLIDTADVPRQEPVVLRRETPSSPRKRTYVFFHAPGQHVAFHESAYQATDDLARTVRKAVSTLLAATDQEVVVTCFSDQLPCAFGYLDADQYAGRLRFLVLDDEQLAPDGLGTLRVVARDLKSQLRGGQEQVAKCVAKTTQAAALLTRASGGQSFVSRWAWPAALESAAFVGRSRIALCMLLIVARVAVRLMRTARGTRAWLGAQKARARTWLGGRWRAIRSRDPWISRRDCIDRLNAEGGDAVVIVPHGFPFPEALLLNKPIVLCLSDESPPPGAPSRGLRGKLRAIITSRLTETAASVLVSSELPQCRLFRARGVIGSHGRADIPCPAERKREADPASKANVAVGGGSKA